jgi:hypothetical protein
MLTESDLAHFTGTTQWYRHALMRTMLYTEGVQFLAEKGEAYWLLDKVATHQLEPRIRREPFQSWKLTLHDYDPKSRSHGATLTADDGNGKVLHAEVITFTDFPLERIELWVEGDVILLPSEH